MKKVLLRLLTALFAGIMVLGLSGSVFLMNVEADEKKDMLSAEPTGDKKKDVRGNRGDKIKIPGQGQDKSPDDVRGPDNFKFSMIFTDED